MLRSERLKAHTIGGGETLVYHVARIARRSRFKCDDGDFLIRACPMLDAAWHDAILAGLESNNPVAELDAHLATPDQEHLVSFSWKCQGNSP
jgi:hypothetical protein